MGARALNKLGSKLNKLSSRFSLSQGNWTKLIVASQIFASIWVLISQLIISTRSSIGVTEEVICSSVLIGLAMLVALLFLVFKGLKAQYLLFLLEFSLIGFAALDGTTSGFQVLFLLSVAKSAYLMKRDLSIVYAALAALSFILVTDYNPKILIQYAEAHLSESSVLVLILGRGMPFFIGQMAVIIGLSQLKKQEAEHLRAAQVIGEEIEELARELEHSRISRDITSNLSVVLAQLMKELHNGRLLMKKDEERGFNSLLANKVVAKRLLKEVRTTLKHLREEESPQ